MITSSSQNLFSPPQPTPRRNRFGVIRGLFYLRLSAFICGSVFVSALLQLPVLGEEPAIRANLSVATTSVEQPVELQIEIQNARVIDPPDVEGDHLEVEMAGQSTRYQLLNGQPSFSSIFSYLVTPSQEGTFKIPPIPITIDGKTYYTNELTLQVTKKAPNNQGAQPDKPYFGELVIPKDSAFVGEPVPIELRFYFDRRIWYQPYPQGQFPIIDGDGFVTKKYPDPVEKEETVNGKPLIWFDNAATTQKPQVVIDRLSHFYAHENSNIHRAAHELAARATDAYEEARDTVAEFIGAPTADDIVFLRGTTEAINLVAHAWGGKHLQPGDEIVITHLEHHANIVPWQLISQKTGAILKWAPIDDAGNLLLSEFEELLGPRTKLVAASQVSNALGTVVPVEKIVELGHRYGARVLIDGAQSIQHMPVDVAELGADFFVFSGHKIYGPTGIGVLYGTEEALTETPPWQGGGHMIADVTTERSLYQGPPTKFEAGTGNIADAVGLAEALRYVERLGIERIAAYEHELLEYATPRLADIPGVRLIGTATEKASVLSFILAGHEPLEVGKALNAEGIAVRAGHHCAQPALRRLGLEATVRPSFAFYNTFEEIDVFLNAVRRIAEGGTNVG